MEVELLFQHKAHSIGTRSAQSRTPNTETPAFGSSSGTKEVSSTLNSSRVESGLFDPLRQYDKNNLPPPPRSTARSTSVVTFKTLKNESSSGQAGDADSCSEMEAGDVSVVFFWDARHMFSGGQKPESSSFASSARSRQSKQSISVLDFGISDETKSEARPKTTVTTATSRRKSIAPGARKSIKPDTMTGKQAALAALEDKAVEAAFREEHSRAMRFYSQRQLQPAIQSLTKALELKTGDKYCLVTRAKCNLSQGRSTEALQDAESSLKSDAQFPRGLLMKAEALYQMGKFELALVFFHRGLRMRPEMNEFKIGVQKAEEAIKKSIGIESVKSGDGFGATQEDDFEVKPTRRTRSSKLPPPSRSVASHRSSRRTVTAPPASIAKRNGIDDKTSKMFLGQLYQDKQFLDKLLREEEIRPHKLKHMRGKRSTNVHELCTDGLSYLNKRTEFWRQQKESAEHKQTKDGREIGRTAEDLRDMYLRRLTEVDFEFHRCDYEGALTSARKLENQVMKEPDVIFQYKPEIIAFIDHFIGNSLLEKGEYTKAMEYFNRERTIGENSNFPEAKSRAFNDIGRAYARIGDYSKAIEIWAEKLGEQTCSPLEEIWLCHEIGRCHYELGNFSTALDYAVRGLDMANAASNRKWIVYCNVLTAQCFTQMECFDKALEHFDLAYDLSEDDDDIRKATKTAIEQITKRIRYEKGRKLFTTYRVNLSLSSIKYFPSESTAQGDAYAVLAYQDGRRTQPLLIGSFNKEDCPNNVELSAEFVNQRTGELSRADVWLEGCENCFTVQAFLVFEDRSGKRWSFDCENGSWAEHDDDPIIQVWRMPARRPED